MSYTLGGTADSNDYVPVLGTVLFAADSDTVDLPVSVVNDSVVEPTKTVTVTLADPGTYQLGNASDTAFIKDNDYANGGSKFIWVSKSTTTWDEPTNWSGGVVPEDGDDVYFLGTPEPGESYYSNVACVIPGATISSLSGLHLDNSYSGTVTLTSALSVSTYEETSGTLNQQTGSDLTITAAMIWTGGTLNSLTESVSSVIVSGAAGLIDPPDTGSMSTASTLKLINTAVVTLLPGTLNILAGQGLYIDADLKGLTQKNVTLDVNPDVIATDAKVEVTSKGTFTLAHQAGTTGAGLADLKLPFQNAGTVDIGDFVRFHVGGRLGVGGPSYSQTAGKTQIKSGSAIQPQFGMTIEGGLFKIIVLKENPTVDITGSFAFDGGTLSFETAPDVPLTFGKLEVSGNMVWTGGSYEPRVDGATNLASDKWIVRKETTIGGKAALVVDMANEGKAKANFTWHLLIGREGIAANPPAFSNNAFTLTREFIPMSKTDVWELKKK